MNYPLLSEYIEAIRLAEDNFDQLSNLQPVLDGGGNPVMSSGNFAVVFKMRDKQTGKLHAVKCFLKEQDGRAEAYRMIAEELEYVDSSYLTPIMYIDKELYVDTNSSDETEFPILLMDWVDGVTLDRYVRENINYQYNLSTLAYRFSRMAMWLMPQPFAHGDLKPDNILVKADGTLVLVDYDGMYVPAMKGQQSRELGSPDFRHPNRTAADFDEHIDDFSLASILLSLKAISLQPGLLEKYGAKDRLLFSEKDYRNIADSKVIDGLKSLLNDKELSTLYSLFLISISLNNLSFVSFRLMEMNKPERPQAIIKDISTEATEEDLANAWTDEYGVMYSQDGQKVLKATKYLNGINYEIRKGVEIVCDRAFQRKGLHGIVLPETIVAIGAVAFANNKNLKNCNIPKSVRYIYDKNPWGGCFNIQKFVNDSPRYKIEDDMLISSDYEVTIGLIYWRQDLNLCIKTKRIAGNAFWSGILRSNSNLKSVDLGKVTKIGEAAFLGCRGLSSITIPESVTSIGDKAFSYCSGLTGTTIHESVTSIGKNVFSSCDKLVSIVVDNNNRFYDSRDNCNAIIETQSNTLTAGCSKTVIPYGVTSIGDNAFSSCSGLTSITIPESVTSIGNYAFKDCSRLTSITIPESVTSIGYFAFRGCSGLASITIPNSVTSIGDSAFNYCSGLTSITIPESVTSIGNNVFYSCDKLACIVVDNNNKFYDSRDNCNAIIETKSNTLIAGCSKTVIPYGVTSIVNCAFESCRGLTNITIPDSVTSIGDSAFSYCSGLTSITIPESVTSIGDSAFYMCSGLISIIIPNGTKEKFEKLLDSSGQGEFKKLLTEEKSLNFEVKGVSFKMIHVDGGTFQMGATSEQESDADSDEYPVHSVTLSDYWIGETQVTQALWQAVMGSNPSRFKGSNRPVEQVSWNDCQEFVNKLNSLLSSHLPAGRKFRLPTESEWEYAARGGNNAVHQTMYAGSDDVDDVAWYEDNSDYETHDVKTKKCNALGIYDMSGNVLEWCQDWYGDYDVENQINPTGPSSGSFRVLRGGCWSLSARGCRVSIRTYGDPSSSNSDLGLRVAL